MKMLSALPNFLREIQWSPSDTLDKVRVIDSFDFFGYEQAVEQTARVVVDSGRHDVHVTPL